MEIPFLCIQQKSQIMFRQFAIFNFIILFLFSCKETKDKPAETGSKHEPVVPKIPVFNPDTAFWYIAKQTEFGPRVPNTKAHVKCGDFLVASFKKYGIAVQEQVFEARAFDGKMLKLRNVIASINPSASKRIIVASHWDARPFADNEIKDKNKPIDGANDGASGVGVILELARLMQSDTSLKVGVDFILFDGEDYGQPENSGFPEMKDSWCLGSQYWAKKPHVPNYSAYYGILLDMVGGKGARFAMDGTSAMFAPEVQKKIWQIAANSGYSSTFINQYSDEIIDDHYYVNRDAKIPMVDIIEYEPSDGSYFSPTWHTHSDNIDNIDKTTLKIVGQTLLNAIYAE
jgi:glutaminyl-peptide cyclotransferase